MRVSRCRADDVFIWVRAMDWMIVNSELAIPRSGATLHSVGIRLRGAISPADSAVSDGVVALPDSANLGSDRTAYVLTGIASDARDVWTNTTRWRRGRRHAGAELVLTVGPDRFHISFEGHASDVVPGSRLTATGDLALVADDEWDAFELADTRADWLVRKVVDLRGGDMKVQLAHPQVA
jgi:hypothetical protein